MVTKLLRKIYQIIEALRKKLKSTRELNYWKHRAKQGFTERDFKYFYTTCFSISEDFYKDKKILDIGCGPRGSLEWAYMCSKRIGLDPLAESYKTLAVDKQKMHYVTGRAERIPFSDEYFDIVSSFNTLDHLDDLIQCINEITRVLKKGGLFLLLTDLNHRPTITEPISFSWDVVNFFLPELKLISQKHYKRSPEGIYQSILANIPYDHSDKPQRPGVLQAKFLKV